MTLCVRSKKKKTPKIKTICNDIFTYLRSKQYAMIFSHIYDQTICNDIFIYLRHKKVQSPTKQFKELFILCPNHFR